MTIREAQALLVKRNKAKGQKRAGLTKQLRKIAGEICASYSGFNAARGCRGCRIENALHTR